jgi:hypothetical protein
MGAGHSAVLCQMEDDAPIVINELEDMITLVDELGFTPPAGKWPGIGCDKTAVHEFDLEGVPAEGSILPGIAVQFCFRDRDFVDGWALQLWYQQLRHVLRDPVARPPGAQVGQHDHGE